MEQIVSVSLTNVLVNYCSLIKPCSHMPNLFGMLVHFKVTAFLL